MRDPLVRQWLNMPAEPSDRDFDSILRTQVSAGAHRRPLDYVVTRRADDVVARRGDRLAPPSRKLRARVPRRADGRGRGLDDARGAAAVRLRCSRGRGAARDPHASGERGVAAARRALRLPARGRGAAVDLAARQAARTRSSGRCCRTTRGDAALAARRARSRDRRSGSCSASSGSSLARSPARPRRAALLAFVGGAFGIVFPRFDDPRARFCARRGRWPLPAPPRPARVPCGRRSRRGCRARSASGCSRRSSSGVSRRSPRCSAASRAGLGVDGAAVAPGDRSRAARRPEIQIVKRC